jgi:tetratricopeptide (TPR) repeat protein
MMRKINLVSYFIAACLSSSPVLADEQSDLLAIQQQWAVANYELEDDAQIKAFTKLSEQSAQFIESYPDSANSYTWNGIVLASFAGAKGGLGALGYAKDAKVSLEQALKIDDSALGGSAYASLATLYSKVPGWPISFGDDDNADKLFKHALAFNQKGIDTNYLYAEFLYDEGKYSQAKAHLLVAQAAGIRDTRAKADEYRQQAISQLLTKVDKKLKR